MRALILLVACAGCSLGLGGSPPAKIRYFTPEPLTAAEAPAPAPPTELSLRLARVDAASHVEDRIAYRDSAAELGYYSGLRWADPPEAYLRRAMATSLFEERRLSETVGGRGPSLEMELVAFEELRAPRHAARIRVTWRLRDGRAVLVQRTLTVERPIAASDPEEVGPAIATAMGAAMEEIVKTVTDEVIAALPAPVVQTAQNDRD